MLIEKVSNPYEELNEGYHCFGCCKRNQKGLKLDFFRFEGKVYANWLPDHDHQGYNNLLHGGIQATLLDEIGAWYVYAIAGTAGFTCRLSVRYKKSIPLNRGKLFLRAGLRDKRRNILDIKAEILDEECNVYASGELEFFTYPVEKAMREMYYPGTEAFTVELVSSSDFGFPDQIFDEFA